MQTVTTLAFVVTALVALGVVAILRGRSSSVETNLKTVTKVSLVLLLGGIAFILLVEFLGPAAVTGADFFVHDPKEPFRRVGFAVAALGFVLFAGSLYLRS